ncbi:MAG: SAM-dependent methyltransferase [Planctomycetota bacterium]
MSEAKVDELITLLALPDEARVLDIACGKAEFLIRTARRWKCSGVGVDLSPYFAADARAKVEGRACNRNRGGEWERV